MDQRKPDVKDIEVGMEDCGSTSTKSSGSMKGWNPSWGERSCPALASFVKSTSFEVAIGVAIVLNCVTMGIEAEILLGHAEGWQWFVDVSEHLFTALFAAELGLRVCILGWRSFVPCHGSVSNFVDAMIVLIPGVLIVWVLPIMGIVPSSALRMFTALRACRLARLVRVVERIPAFTEIWRLVRGFTGSMRTLFWTLAFIFVVTYIFAVFGVVLISTQVKELLNTEILESNQEELSELVSLTDGIFTMMHTLVQVLTLDSWNGIARPLMKYIWWSVFYFYAYISVGVVVLLNLVTAEIVDTAMKNSQKDSRQLLLEKHEQEKHLMREFRSLFEMVDGDGDNKLTWTEFQDAFEVPAVATKLEMLDFQPQSCQELFSLLDTGDGSLTLGEFFEGIQAMEGPAKSKDSFKMLKLVERMNQSLQELVDSGSRLSCSSCFDKLGTVASHENACAGDRQQSVPETITCAAQQVSKGDLVKELLAVPPAPCFNLPPSPIEAYATGPSLSPAFTTSRRKQLFTCRDQSVDCPTESTVDSTSRIDDVADQVGNCNRKVDGLATSLAQMQRSLALVVQRLDCN